MKIKFIQTSPACLEQYEAFDEAGKQVGYLRLRHGWFRVDFPEHSGETIYEARSRGDGVFDNDEKDLYLQQAYNAIVAKLSRTTDKGQSWYVVIDNTLDSYELK